MKSELCCNLHYPFLGGLGNSESDPGVGAAPLGTLPPSRSGGGRGLSYRSGRGRGSPSRSGRGRDPLPPSGGEAIHWWAVVAMARPGLDFLVTLSVGKLALVGPLGLSRQGSHFLSVMKLIPERFKQTVIFNPYH